MRARLWHAVVETYRPVEYGVLAIDCEHAAYQAARRFRRDHGVLPMRVRVSLGERSWVCKIDYVRGEALAVEGPGVSAPSQRA